MSTKANDIWVDALKDSLDELGYTYEEIGEMNEDEAKEIVTLSVTPEKRAEQIKKDEVENEAYDNYAQDKNNW